MKKVIALAIIGTLVLSGCGGSTKQQKDVAAKEDIEGIDYVEEILKEGLNDIGISEYEVISYEWGIAKLVLYANCKVGDSNFKVSFVEERDGTAPWRLQAIEDTDANKYYYSTIESVDVYDYSTGELIRKGAPIEIPTGSKIESSIRNHVDKSYRDTDIDSVTVNNDSIALVHLTWNVKNTADTTKKTLKMYSDDLAATMAQEHKELTEIAVFWKVPYLSSDCKWHYECKDGKAFMDDSFVNF